MREQLKWYDEKADNSAWIDALAELRQRATREGHCYQHVQAITVAIDQYAEKALGNRDYFLNKPYGVVSFAAMKQAGIRILTGPVCHRNLIRSDLSDCVSSPNGYCDRPAGCRAFRCLAFSRRRAPCA
jgi:hypothetical protein